MTDVATSLERAFARIGDFNSVQHGRPQAELEAAVELLQESVGIDDDARAVLHAQLDGIPGSGRAPGHVLLGLIVGLTAAELRRERS